MADGCVFCDVISGKESRPIVGEWSDLVAFGPDKPDTPGHLLVVPKRHVESPTQDILLTGTMMIGAAKILRTLQYDANIIMNCGTEAGQTVPHIHLHVVPRRKHDLVQLKYVPKET